MPANTKDAAVTNGRQATAKSARAGSGRAMMSRNNKRGKRK